MFRRNILTAVLAGGCCEGPWAPREAQGRAAAAGFRREPSEGETSGAATSEQIRGNSSPACLK